MTILVVELDVPDEYDAERVKAGLQNWYDPGTEASTWHQTGDGYDYEIVGVNVYQHTKSGLRVPPITEASAGSVFERPEDAEIVQKLIG